MTWLEIYNAVCMRIWGVQAPPEGAVQLLQGQYGVIAEIHRNIQRKRNYWFMDANTTVAVLTGNPQYPLPADFKEFAYQGIRFIDATSGLFYEPLRLLLPGDYKYFSTIDTADYPEYYAVYEDQLVLMPIPESDQTLYVMYWKYLARPPAVFDTSSDALTIYGADVIYNLAAAEVLTAQEEYQKAQMYEVKGQQALEVLNGEDESRRLGSEVIQVPYQEV
jgi:hypothetical protein